MNKKSENQHLLIKLTRINSHMLICLVHFVLCTFICVYTYIRTFAYVYVCLSTSKLLLSQLCRFAPNFCWQPQCLRIPAPLSSSSSTAQELFLFLFYYFRLFRALFRIYTYVYINTYLLDFEFLEVNSLNCAIYANVNSILSRLSKYYSLC